MTLVQTRQTGSEGRYSSASVVTRNRAHGLDRFGKGCWLVAAADLRGIQDFVGG